MLLSIYRMSTTCNLKYLKAEISFTIKSGIIYRSHVFCPRATDDTRSGWSVLPLRPRLCLEVIPAMYQEAIYYFVP